MRWVQHHQLACSDCLFSLLVQLACSACLFSLLAQSVLCMPMHSHQTTIALFSGVVGISLSPSFSLSLSSHVARTIDDDLFGPAQSLTSERTKERRRDLSTHTHTHQLTLASDEDRARSGSKSSSPFQDFSLFEFSFVFKSFCSKLFTSYKLRIFLSLRWLADLWISLGRL